MRILTVLLFSIFCISSLSAQVDTSEAVKVDMTESSEKGDAAIGAFGESVKSDAEAKKSKLSRGYYKKPTALSEEFTGYTIQLVTSMERLSEDDALFTEFGNLKVEENINPRYCYMLGEFKTKEGAEKFLNTVILQRYPNAKLLYYKKGKRKKID